MSDELAEILDSAEIDLKDWVNDYRKENDGDLPDDVGDQIHEITDAACPVYTSTILQIMVDNLGLAQTVPELGPAFDGEMTPCNVSAAVIYDYIEQHLWEVWHGIGSDVEEEEEEDE